MTQILISLLTLLILMQSNPATGRYCNDRVRFLPLALTVAQNNLNYSRQFRTEISGQESHCHDYV